MEATKSQIILLKEDYDLMIAYLRGTFVRTSFDRDNAEMLEAELKNAKLVSKDQFPEDVIRLNSKVKVKDEMNGKMMELTLVTPDKVDIKSRKVSVMAPIGTALIGFRKGQQVSWRVPAGEKTFTIIEVSNDEEQTD
ncbi:MAG TPA: nucleoside diphosphate kinase regulator [Parasegetibacter sp.]